MWALSWSRAATVPCHRQRHGVAGRPAQHRRATMCPAVYNSTSVKADQQDPLCYLASHGLQQKDVEVAAARNPELLQVQESRLESMFQVFSEYGLDSHDVQNMLQSSPYLFNHSPQDKVRPCLDWLELQLGLSRQQVAEVVRRFPAVLGYGVKSHLVPHMAYLKSLGVSEQQLPQLVLERPYVLGAGIETLVQYLTKELRIKRTHTGTLLRHFPFDYSLQFLRFPPVAPEEAAASNPEGSNKGGGGSSDDEGSSKGSEGGSSSSSSAGPAQPSAS